MPAGLTLRLVLLAAGCALPLAGPALGAPPRPASAPPSTTRPEARPEPAAAETVVPAGQPLGPVVPAGSADTPDAERAVAARTALLAGELAMSRRQPAEAARQLATALALAPSVDVARAATGAALAAELDEQALAGARQWYALAPTDPDAADALFVTALRSGDADTVVRLGQARLDRPPAAPAAPAERQPSPPAPPARKRGRHAPPAARPAPPTADADANTAGEAREDDDDDTPSPGSGDPQFALAALILGAEPNAPAARRAGLATFQRILANRSVTAGGHEGLAALALAAEDGPTAERESGAALAADPRRYTARLLRLRLLARTQHYDDAERLIADTQALGQDPAALRLAYARILAAQDHRAAARAQLEKNLAGRTSGDRTEATLLLGVIDLDDDRPADARRRFEGLLASPRKSEAAYYLGRIAEAQGDTTTAMDRYAQATSGVAGLEATLRRANLLAAAGRTGEAHEVYDTLRRVVPPEAARFDLAEASSLEKAGRRTEALAVLDSGLNREPDDAPLLYARGILRERVGDRAGAEADLRRFTRLAPDDPAALNALAYLLSDTPAARPEALGLARRALSLSPDDAAIQDTWGWLLHLNGQTAEALAPLSQAFTGQPDGEIGAHLGEVQWRLGHPEEARRTWQHAATVDPDNPVLRQTVARLTGTPLPPPATAPRSGATPEATP